MPAPSTPFEIFPALHLRRGRLIDMTLASDEGSFEADPLDSARRWIDEGARWLHVVDVDATFDRDASANRPVIEALATLPVSLQFSGGQRTAEDIAHAMALGIDRLLVSTAAVETPELIARAIAEYGRERLGLSIVTDETGAVLTHGWQSAGGLEAVTLAIQMGRLGIGTAVHSRVLPDGTMTGTDLATSCELAALSGLNVIVGGEVRDLDDVVACYNQPGITGVLIGRALQNGTLDLRTAVDETRSNLAFESGVPYWKAQQSSLAVRVRRALARANLLDHLPVQDGLRVLDAGGGTGLASLPLAAAGATVDLVERSRAMLAEFEADALEAGLRHRVTAHVLDIREIHRRFDISRFDLVLCHNVIQYSEDWQTLLSSMTAPLARGGLLSLVARNWFGEPYGVDLASTDIDELPHVLTRERGASRLFDTDVRFFSAPFLADWLTGHGFEVVADYGLMCRHVVPEPATDADAQVLLDKSVVLERLMGARDPYKQTARYVQLIARKR